MKKKLTLVIALLILLLALVGCEKDYVPDPAVEEYLNGGLSAQKAFDALTSVSYQTTITVQNKNGDELGKQISTVNFDVSDKTAVTLTTINVFSGTLVQNDVTEQTTTLTKNGDKYVYQTVTDVELQNSVAELEEQVALDLVTALVYVDNGAYDASGLYYGDIFMLKIYKFPPESFYVDEETDLCVFDQKMLIVNDDMSDVRLYQTTKINRLGLLVSSYEKYESVDDDYVMVTEVTAQYNYAESTN